MNTDYNRIRWLVVDDSLEDAEDIALAIESLGDRSDVVNDLKAAERALKKQVYDACVVDCFYKGSKKTGEDLIPILRSTNVSIPIVMVSSSPDHELPARVVEAGADIFINKSKNHLEFYQNLRAAHVQAKTFRKLRAIEAVSKHSAKLFLGINDAKKIDSTCKRPDESVLVRAHAGCGKTSVASLIAESQSCGFSSSKSLFHIDCSTMNEVQAQDKLFGSKDLTQVGFLHIAPGGVVIIENVDALSPMLQNKLKDFFAKLASGPQENVNKTKFIFTAGRDEQKVSPGFFETIGDREIILPSIPEIDKAGNLLPAVTQVINSEITSLGLGEFRFEDAAISYFETLVRSRTWSNNFRGIRKVVRETLELALGAGRTKVLRADFEEGLNKAKCDRPLNTSVDDRLVKLLAEPEGYELINSILSGENYKGSRVLLQKLLLRFSARRFERNKTKMSEALGVSRVALYELEQQIGGVCDA